MANIRTMALEINENTYSIAVACLPPGFATIPFSDVDGHYLIINEKRVQNVIVFKKKTERKLTIGNNWQSARRFEKDYKCVDKDTLPYAFTEVEKI